MQHGSTQNAALELVPVDRGAVALYRVTAHVSEALGDASGTLRLAYQMGSRAHATGELLMSSAPGPVLVEGDLSTQACMDANGWVAYSSLSEQLRLENGTRSGLQLASNIRLVPGDAAVPPVWLLPLAVPQASILRVGDELSSAGFGMDTTIGRTRGHDACTASHRVTAVEELRVEAGSLEAARIDSSLRCGTAVQVDWISWVASEVGVARFELSKPGGFVTLELACFETAETPGRCPAPSAPAMGSGVSASGGDPPPSAAVALHWTQPSPTAPVDQFRVYKGPATDQGSLVYAGLPSADAQGVYSTDVQISEIAAGTPVYVWLTAANAAGESVPSNAKLFASGESVSLDSLPGAAPINPGTR